MTLLVFISSLLGSMAIGMPIAFALLVAGLALMLQLNMFDSQIVAQNLINGSDSFPLMAVPFFVLAGEIMNRGGLSRRIVTVALALVGHIRGGLGYVTVVAACIMAAVSGSALADAAALSALVVPMMVAAGHNRSRAAGLVAAAGCVAPVFPPSVAFIIFAVSANLSITKLFFAGILPGLMMAAALALAWWWAVREELIVPPPRTSMHGLGRALVDAAWALFMPFIIVFGLKFGVITPTESGVVAAVYALLVATLAYRELKWSELYSIVAGAARTTAVIMFLVAASLVSAWLITVADLPQQLVSMLEPFMQSKTLLMLAMMIVVMIVGTAMDMAPTILILTPVLMPIVNAAGIDPIYFGVLFVMNNAIGLITPPVGTVLNVVAGVSRVAMGEVTRGVAPFLLAEFAVLLVLTLFPELVTIPAAWWR